MIHRQFMPKSLRSTTNCALMMPIFQTIQPIIICKMIWFISFSGTIGLHNLLSFARMFLYKLPRPGPNRINMQFSPITMIDSEMFTLSCSIAHIVKPFLLQMGSTITPFTFTAFFDVIRSILTGFVFEAFCVFGIILFSFNMPTRLTYIAIFSSALTFLSTPFADHKSPMFRFIEVYPKFWKITTRWVHI